MCIYPSYQQSSNRKEQITPHLLSIHDQLHGINDHLEQNKKYVSIIIMINDSRTTFDTEGFQCAIKLLQSLPVRLVIRVHPAAYFYDDEKMESFYKNLEHDKSVIIRDFESEAREVHKYQKWLNYAAPLQRCREIGCCSQVLNALNKRKLTLDEIRTFCTFLFDDEQLPDPVKDWKGFMRAIQHALSYENDQMNPIKKKDTPWINVKKLDKIYGKRRSQ